MEESAPKNQSPTTSPLLTDLDTLQAEAESQESQEKKPPEPFSRSESDADPLDVAALVGDATAQLLVDPAYDVVGYLVDRPTLREYIPASAKVLHGTLLDLTIRKYFPGESLANYPELLLALSAGAVITAAMEKAPTTAQLTAGHRQPPAPAEGPRPPEGENTGGAVHEETMP